MAFDDLVQVDELRAVMMGKAPADGGLSAAGEADEDDVHRARAARAAQSSPPEPDSPDEAEAAAVLPGEPAGPEPSAWSCVAALRAR